MLPGQPVRGWKGRRYRFIGWKRQDREGIDYLEPGRICHNVITVFHSSVGWTDPPMITGALCNAEASYNAAFLMLRTMRCAEHVCQRDARAFADKVLKPMLSPRWEMSRLAARQAHVALLDALQSDDGYREAGSIRAASALEEAEAEFDEDNGGFMNGFRNNK